MVIDPIKKLTILRMSQMMVEGPGNPFETALKNLSSREAVSAHARMAQEWVDTAIDAILAAPDAKELGIDTREKAAQACLDEYEKKVRDREQMNRNPVT